MPINYKGKEYRSKKHPILEYIFEKKTNNRTIGIGENHTFLLSDIADGYRHCEMLEPVSISNTILDLTRKNNGIHSRLPQSIIDLGYDLRKKTGLDADRKKYAGEFVYVGIGNELQSWLVWPEAPYEKVVVENKVPSAILALLSNDEGALFSVIDYCDALSHAIYHIPNTILRVQNPMKWQPNEVDGLYFSNNLGREILFPVEAKALSTKDDINLEQMNGGLKTIHSKRPQSNIVSLALQMIPNGFRLAIFQETKAPELLKLERFILVTFDPPIPSWR